MKKFFYTFIQLSFLFCPLFAEPLFSETGETRADSEQVQTEKGKTDGRKYALLVGVSKYSDGIAEQSFDDLNGPVRDVNLLKEELLLCGYKEDDIILLTSASENDLLPKTGNINLKIDDILKEKAVGEGDTVFLFFSGHGCRYGNVDYFCPESFKIDDGEYEKNGISIPGLVKKLEASKASFRWVFIDACRNDPFSAAKSEEQGAGERKDGSRVSAEPFGEPQLGSVPDILLFQSCRAGETSKEADIEAVLNSLNAEGTGKEGEIGSPLEKRLVSIKKRKENTEKEKLRTVKSANGYFTWSLAKALEGNCDTDGNGRLVLSEIGDYVTAETIRLSQGSQNPFVQPKENLSKDDVFADIAEVRYNLSREHLGKKDYDTAVSLIQKALKIHPENKDYLQVKDKILAKMTGDVENLYRSEEGDLDEANTLVNAIQKAEPESSYALKASDLRREKEKSLREGSTVLPTKKGGDKKELSAGGIKYSFCWCPPGSFMMGSPESETGRYTNEKQHKAEIQRGFWLLETEVTQEMWESVMGEELGDLLKKHKDEPIDPQLAEHMALLKRRVSVLEHKSNLIPDEARELAACVKELNALTGLDERARNLSATLRGYGPDRPIYLITWFEAVEFCGKLAEKFREEGYPDMKVTLPYEAEWEYACRAGSRTPFSFGSDGSGITEYGNTADITFEEEIPNAGYEYLVEDSKLNFGWKALSATDRYPFAAPVKSYKPNPWGLYDMHGNVCEWCFDSYQNDAKRIRRGGGWFSDLRHARSACRAADPPVRRLLTTGFRIRLEPADWER